VQPLRQSKDLGDAIATADVSKLLEKDTLWTSFVSQQARPSWAALESTGWPVTQRDLAMVSQWIKRGMAGLETAWSKMLDETTAATIRLCPPHALVGDSNSVRDKKLQSEFFAWPGIRDLIDQTNKLSSAITTIKEMGPVYRFGEATRESHNMARQARSRAKLCLGVEHCLKMLTSEAARKADEAGLRKMVLQCRDEITEYKLPIPDYMVQTLAVVAGDEGDEACDAGDVDEGDEA
jgi:hypothetical protein